MADVFIIHSHMHEVVFGSRLTTVVEGYTLLYHTLLYHTLCLLIINAYDCRPTIFTSTSELQNLSLHFHYL